MDHLTTQLNAVPSPSSRAVTESVVRFRLRDVHVPSAEELLEELFGDMVLSGKVIVQSSNGDEAPCVAVQLEGSQKLVVVSTDRLL